VRGIGGISAAGAPPARRGARAASGFALPGDRPATAAAASAPSGIAALLSVQDEDAGAPAKRETPLRRAALALDELRGLQLALLRGCGDDPARLERLAALANGADLAAEPALRSLIAEVRLRARVELARRHAQNAGGAAR
jgi:hypothetical protein